jgi:hypothetical protein
VKCDISPLKTSITHKHNAHNHKVITNTISQNAKGKKPTATLLHLIPFKSLHPSSRVVHHLVPGKRQPRNRHLSRSRAASARSHSHPFPRCSLPLSMASPLRARAQSQSPVPALLTASFRGVALVRTRPITVTRPRAAHCLFPWRRPCAHAPNHP